jgi:nicotinate-nucleotide adenylyltransferase
VDSREIERRGRSYTVATLAELRVEAPLRPLGMLVGADAFLGLPGWHRWTEIFDLAHVIVVARPGVALEESLPPPLAHQWTRRYRDDPIALSQEPAGSIVMQAITPHAIAASAIRAQLVRGSEGVNAVRGLLPAAVLAYIDRNQLYRSRPDAP